MDPRNIVLSGLIVWIAHELGIIELIHVFDVSAENPNLNVALMATFVAVVYNAVAWCIALVYVLFAWFIAQTVGVTAIMVSSIPLYLMGIASWVAFAVTTAILYGWVGVNKELVLELWIFFMALQFIRYGSGPTLKLTETRTVSNRSSSFSTSGRVGSSPSISFPQSEWKSQPEVVPVERKRKRTVARFIRYFAPKIMGDNPFYEDGESQQDLPL